MGKKNVFSSLADKGAKREISNFFGGKKNKSDFFFAFLLDHIIFKAFLPWFELEEWKFTGPSQKAVLNLTACFAESHK